MNFKVATQGKPMVNPHPPRIIADSEDFIAFEIDMRSKWCEVYATGAGSDGSISLYVGTTDRSCHLDDSMELPWTEIALPDHNCDEWDIFVTECCRYTLRVVLTKRSHPASA